MTEHTMEELLRAQKILRSAEVQIKEMMAKRGKGK